MGIFASTVSITRYTVRGTLADPVVETISKGLKKHTIVDIDEDPMDKAVGWTSLEDPFTPDFTTSSHMVGNYVVFSLRLDKKSIPPKVVKKHYLAWMARRLKETGRDHLSRNEKQEIKDQVVHALSLRIPATPNVYDLLWDHEGGRVWFFTTLKTANEALETLFSKAFDLTLIRLFPFTLADLRAGLSPEERDALSSLSPTKLTE